MLGDSDSTGCLSFDGAVFLVESLREAPYVWIIRPKLFNPLSIAIGEGVVRYCLVDLSRVVGRKHPKRCAGGSEGQVDVGQLVA